MILIDDGAGSGSSSTSRTPGQDLISHTPLSNPSVAMLGRLPSPSWSDTRADAMFCGNGPDGRNLKVGIEVKKWTELLSSLDTGRLQATQLPGLVELYDIRFLVHYGPYQPNPDTGNIQALRKRGDSWVWVDFQPGSSNANGGRARTYSYGYLSRFLCSPQFLSMGITSVRVSSIAEAAWWIGETYAEWTKPWSHHKSIGEALDRTSAPSPISLRAHEDPKMQQCIQVASTFPNIRYRRAVAMAEHFQGSTRAMVNATAEELASVKVKDKETGKERKLGKSLAMQIDERLG